MKQISDLLIEARQYFAEDIEKWGSEKAVEYGTAHIIPFVLLEGIIGRYIDGNGVK